MINLNFDGVAQVQTYLGRVLDAQEQSTARLHLAQSAAMAREVTRGRGFDPLDPLMCSEALASVIVARACRSMSNPTDMSGWSASGVSQRPGRTSWTLAELRLLEGLRRSSGSLSA